MTYRLWSSQSNNGCLLVQESSSFSVHEDEHLGWSSVDTGILKKQALMPVKEWTCQQGESKQAKSKSFPFPCSFYRLPWEGIARLKVDLPTSKDLDYRLVFPPQNTWVKSGTFHFKEKSSHRCSQQLGFYFIPDEVKLTSKSCHYRWLGHCTSTPTIYEKFSHCEPLPVFGVSLFLF